MVSDKDVKKSPGGAEKAWLENKQEALEMDAAKCAELALILLPLSEDMPLHTHYSNAVTSASIARRLTHARPVSHKIHTGWV